MIKTPDGKADPKDDRLSSFEVAIADLLFDAAEKCTDSMPEDIAAEDFVRFKLLTQIINEGVLGKTLSEWSPEKQERIRNVAVWVMRDPPEGDHEDAARLKAGAERMIGVLKTMEGYHER